MKEVIIEVLAQGFALLPVSWELWNDRNGEDVKGKREDIAIRIILAALCGLVIMLLHNTLEPNFPSNAYNWWMVLGGIALAAGWHFLLFDYYIAAILKKRGIIHYDGRFGWFSYTGKTSKFDKFELWKWLHPVNRLIIRLIVWEIGILTYKFCHL